MFPCSKRFLYRYSGCFLSSKVDFDPDNRLTNLIVTTANQKRWQRNMVIESGKLILVNIVKVLIGGWPEFVSLSRPACFSSEDSGSPTKA